MKFPWPSTLPSDPIAQDIHVWIWQTPAGSDHGIHYRAILSPEERKRMDSFRFSQDSRNYLICHAYLRTILGFYSGQLPENLAFETNTHGKPSLHGDSDLFFNLSHSEDVGLLAITRTAPIGADIEYVRPIEKEVAEAHFSPDELSVLGALDKDQWLLGFFRCWTRKEAILKAEGKGLNLALDGFDVTLRSNEPAALIAVRPDAGLTQHWKLEHLDPAPGLIAAVATEASYQQLRCFHYPGI
jgi:4'-phosphopantetheinyl transferase